MVKEREAAAACDDGGQPQQLFRRIGHACWPRAERLSHVGEQRMQDIPDRGEPENVDPNALRVD